jgi:hypothetical protein
MKIFRLAVRAAVLLTTGPPLLAMAACTASTVTTLQALSGPAADIQTVSAATAQQYAADYYLSALDGRSDPQFGAPWHAVGRDHDVIVSAYQGFKP